VVEPRWAALLVGLFAVALGARIAVFELGRDRPNQDERAYVELAVEWATTGELARRGVPETHIGPLFPALHGVALLSGAPPHGSARYLALLLSALAAPAALWAARPLLGGHAALAAGLLVAFQPRLLKTAEWIQPEHLTAVLWLVFGGALLRRRRLLAAAALGLAYLSRPEAALLLPIWWLFELVVEPRAWRRMLVASILSLAIAAPYVLHLRSALGAWALTGKTEWVYQLGWVEVEGDRQPVAHQDYRRIVDATPGPTEHLRRSPGRFAAGYARRLVYAGDYLKEALSWPLFVLGWLGLGAALWRDRERARFFLPLALLVCVPVVVVHARHVLPYVPLLLVAAVAAAQLCVERLRGPTEVRRPG
jgi:4-amino-4-deoxy-L-arabinose transferase-like glycosyltransferase